MAKNLTFCKLLYHRKCKRRRVGSQKKKNLVNVVCERPIKIKSFKTAKELRKKTLTLIGMSYGTKKNVQL